MTNTRSAPPNTVLKTWRVPNALAEAVRDFRHMTKAATERAAVETLLRAGLAAEAIPRREPNCLTAAGIRTRGDDAGEAQR